MILNGCFQACAKSFKATSQNVLIIFCMWLDKHKYIYAHVHLRHPKSNSHF